MNLLAIDTSTKRFSLAVVREGVLVRYCNISSKKVLSDVIMSAIEAILRESHLTLPALNGFVVGLGPGSFTSLRVGLATIKGLVFVTRKPVVGIPSLDALAMAVPHDGKVCVVCDARRNLVYACLYEKKGSTLRRKSKYLLTDMEDVLRRLKGKITLIGDSAPLFQGAIKKITTIQPHFVPKRLLYPQAQHLATLAIERFKAGKYDAIESLVPLYLYPQDCQVQDGRRG